MIDRLLVDRDSSHVTIFFIKLEISIVAHFERRHFEPFGFGIEPCPHIGCRMDLGYHLGSLHLRLH